MATLLFNRIQWVIAELGNKLVETQLIWILSYIGIHAT